MRAQVLSNQRPADSAWIQTHPLPGARLRLFCCPFAGDSAVCDGELLTKLCDYAGTPPEMLANQELMALLLPAIRADFALLSRYRYRQRPRLDVPMNVQAGYYDAHVGQETRTTGRRKPEQAANCTASRAGISSPSSSRNSYWNW